MKKLLAFLILITPIIYLPAQINNLGFPFYQYYDSKQYNATDQNWQTVQDNNGLIYVANGESLLQFDGESWRKITIKNDPVIRSIAIDSLNIVYIGGDGEFGYLLPNLSGDLEYHSLIPKLDSTFKNSIKVFSVYELNNSIYYSTANSFLLCYNFKTDSLKKIIMPKFSFNTFTNKKKIYGGNYAKGLFSIEDDSVQLCKGGEFFSNKNIFKILFQHNNIEIVTGNQGIFNYNDISGISTQIIQPVELSTIKDFKIYSACKVGSDYILASLGKGIFIVNQQGQIKEILDSSIGILDHNCTSVDQFHKGQSLWASLTMGLASIEIESPFRSFSSESGIEGVINSIIKFENTLYIGTDNGIYYQDLESQEMPRFIKIKGIDVQTWSLSIFTNSKNEKFILAGTIDGIFQFKANGKNIAQLEENTTDLSKVFGKETNQIPHFYVYKLIQSDKSGIVWATHRDKVVGLSCKDGNWKVLQVFELGDEVRYLQEDTFGNIWASTSLKGICKIYPILSTYKMELYNTKQGLPANNAIKFSLVDGNIVFVSPRGIYTYNSVLDSIQPLSSFPKRFIDGSTALGKIKVIKDSIILCNSSIGTNNELVLLKKGNLGFVEVGSFFKRFKNITVEDFYIDKNILWFSASNRLYSYQIENTTDLDSTYNCNIRLVSGLDTNYFKGSYYETSQRGLVPSNKQNEDQKPIINFSNNELIFHFAAAFYEGKEETKYSYQLFGFKDQWSKWDSESKAVYTNLSPGQYTFKVKARNVYDIESKVGTYSFTILPPWYRTWVAYFGYVLIALFSVWLIVKLYTRKLKQEKIWLEGVVRERTAEIREQRDEIAEQKQSIEDSILYARRIQRAILPSKELADSVLPEYFILFRPRDIVSGDYYWINKIGHRTIVVAADCTGHGVPGAFMSMLGLSFLNEIVLQENVVDAHLILNKLRERIKRTLRQEGKEGEAKDGMDVALIVIDEEMKKLFFAGAYNPAYIFRGTELVELKADRMPIGIYIKEKESFTLNEYDYLPGDTFYIASDGYADQFGGQKKEKLKSKAMKEYLASIQDKGMEEQRELLNQYIEDWMGSDQEQVDDMVVIGVRLR